MKMILAAMVAGLFLASAPAFVLAADKASDKKEEKKADKADKKEEKKADKGW